MSWRKDEIDNFTTHCYQLNHKHRVGAYFITSKEFALRRQLWVVNETEILRRQC